MVTKNWKRFYIENITDTFSTLELSYAHRLVSKIEALKLEFLNLQKNFSISDSFENMEMSTEVFIIVQSTQFAIFLIILTLSFWLCYKQRKPRNKQLPIAHLGPEPKDFVLVKKLLNKDETLD